LYDNQIISGSLSNTSDAANVTILQNNFPLNSYVATRFYIVGNYGGGQLTAMQDASGVYLDTSGQSCGELVIECSNTQGSDKLRLCYLLFTGQPSGDQGTDSLVQVLQSSLATSPKTVDFGSAIAGSLSSANTKSTIHKSYIMYTNGNYTYVVSAVPIHVAASLIFSNGSSSNSSIIDFSTVASYTIIGMQDSGTWMECDYSPLGSFADTATVLNVPISSMSDMNADQSFRQIIMFLVFLIALVVFYFIIPPLYQMIIWKLANNDVNAMCNVMNYFDYGYNIIFGLLWFILLMVGVTSTDKNASNVLYSGIVIGVVHLITFGTISVSKYSPNFPFEGREQRCQPAATASATAGPGRAGMMSGMSGMMSGMSGMMSGNQRQGTSGFHF
jgi:hypothetical protein